jgi:TPR repeat protein
LPPLGATSEFRIGQVVRAVAVVAGAAFVAFVVVSGIPYIEAERLREFLSAWQSPPAEKAARLPVASARLLVQDIRGHNDQWLPLAARAEGESTGTMILVSGLLPGTKFSSGQPIGETAWLIGAGELPALHVQAPAGFSGSMDLLVELRTPDNTILDRKMLRAEWMATKLADAGNAAVAPSSNAARWTDGSAFRGQLRQLDPAEIAGLLKRGEAFLTNGDVAGARLVLQRAAEHGNARAAFALGSSYDPAALQRLGVYGPAPNLQLARQWYERAAEYGSKEAEARLQILARRDP